MQKLYILEELLRTWPDYEALMKGIDNLADKPSLTEQDKSYLESAIEQLCKGEAPYFTNPSLKWRAFEDFKLLIKATNKPANSDAQVITIFLALRIRDASYRNSQGEEARRYYAEAYQVVFDFFMKESENGAYPEIDMLLHKIDDIKKKYPQFSLIVVDSGRGNDIDLIAGADSPLLEAQMRNIPTENNDS